MSDSGSTQLPPNVQNSSAASSRKSDSYVKARVNSAPREIINSRQSEQTERTPRSTERRSEQSSQPRIQGRVIAKSNDGTVRIDTRQGVVEAKLPPSPVSSNIQKGQDVDIQIVTSKSSSGVPEVRVYPQTQSAAEAAALPTEEPAPPLPQNIQTTDAKSYQNAIRADASISLSEETARLNSAAPNKGSAPLTEGRTIRFIPLTPAQIKTVSLQPALETIPQTLTPQAATKTVLSSSLLTANQSAQPPALLTTQSFAASPPQIVTNSALNNAPQTAAQNAALTGAPAAPNISAPLQTITTQSTTQNTALTPQILSAVFTSAHSAENTNLLTTHSARQQASTFVSAQTFDAQIVSVQNNIVTFQPQHSSEARQLHSHQISTQGAQHHASNRAAVKVGTITTSAGTTLPVVSLQQNTAQNVQNLSLSSTHFPLANLQDQTLFALQFPADNLPIGSQVTLSTSSSSTAGAAPAQNITASPAFSLAPVTFPQLANMQWPALNELNQIIQQPQAMATSVSAHMANVTPSPASPAQLPAVALFMISVMRSGDLGGWMGNKTIDALKAMGKGDLLSRLTRDLGNISRMGSEPALGDWRPVPLPMQAEGQIQHIMLYFKDQQNKDGNEEEQSKGKDTRFVFDLSLSRMGAVQIDGYHRNKKDSLEQNKGRLDLIVRTQKPLSSSMQQRMRQTYVSALEAVNASGELSFQGQPEKFIKFGSAESSEHLSA